MSFTKTQTLSGTKGSESRFETAVARIGVAGLYLCALGTWLSTAMQGIGLALAVLSFVVDRRAWRWAFTSPVFWLCGGMGVYVFARAHFGALEFPPTAELQTEAARDWIKLLIFLPLAWLLWQAPARIPRVMALCALGLLAGTLMALDPDTIRAVMGGARFGGRLSKPIAFAFYVSVCLLGMALLAPRWLSRPSGNRWIGWLLIAATGIVTVLLAWLFLASQSRGPLLAMAGVFPIALAVRYWPGRKTAPGTHRAGWAVAAGIAGVVLLFGIYNADHLAQRIEAEMPSAGIVFDQGLDQAPRNSTTLRLQMWRFALEKWAERPWFGWGPGSIRHLLEQEQNPALHFSPSEPWDHLHNAYVQALFSFGVTGAALIGMLLALLCAGVMREYRQGRVPRDMAVFVLANFGLIAVYSLTDFRHLNHDWSSYWQLLAAIALALGTPAGPQESIPAPKPSR